MQQMRARFHIRTLAAGRLFKYKEKMSGFDDKRDEFSCARLSALIAKDRKTFLDLAVSIRCVIHFVVHFCLNIHAKLV